MSHAILLVQPNRKQESRSYAGKKPLFGLKHKFSARFRVSQRSCRGYLQDIRGAAQEGECIDETDHL